MSQFTVNLSKAVARATTELIKKYDLPMFEANGFWLQEYTKALDELDKLDNK